MGIRNLDKIFSPRSVAVIGASDDPAKVGSTVLKNLIGGGFPGKVYPVNTHRQVIQGLPAFPSVRELPELPDLAVICTPAATVPNVVAECGDAGVRGLVILSAGFREAGAGGVELERQLRQTWLKYDGLRIIGPNCLGVIVPAAHLNASFAADAPQAGHVALISQSGALCTSLLDWSVEKRIGFSHFVSVGNMLDVGFGDLIDYFGTDPETRSMLLYLESISDVRSFMSAARAFSRTKPIVAYKAGRFLESARAAASHTGAMAGEDAVCDAGFQRAGIERVYTIDNMFHCVELLARHRPPQGERLAIVTNAGGPGVIATDALMAQRGKLADLTDSTLTKLNELLPAAWSHGNPIDVLGDATPAKFSRALELVLDDRNVDAALVILTPQAMTDPSETAARVGEVAGRSGKPVLAAWVGGRRVQQGRQRLTDAGIPNYGTPENAVNAFKHLISYARNLELLYETPRDIPLALPLNRDLLRERFEHFLNGDADILSEQDSKSLLDGYGIPVVQTCAAATPESAVEHARRIGYPVALKVLSPQITHKTDVGGVALGLLSDEGVRAAFERIVTSAKGCRPDAEVRGVTVQQMISTTDSVELIVGMKKDATFGAVLMVGGGGITAEVYCDRALGLPPLTEALARRMLESLRLWPLLRGYRGKPPVDLAKLTEVLLRLSYLVADHPEIRELDVNPLLVSPQGVVAVDARVIIDRPPAGQRLRPYSHLAIRPYPVEYIRNVRLPNGTLVTLRPIRPEDEPMWHQLLSACSPETLHARFGYAFKEATHEMAARYCFIDYDREMALVAIIQETGEFAGVGRLVADPDHQSAEYALLVADAWQELGLGTLLTDNCLSLAQDWGIRRVTATTMMDNSRMIAIFQQRGFEVQRTLGDDMLLQVHKAIAGN